MRLGVAIAPPRVARRLRRAVGLPEFDGVLVRAVSLQSKQSGNQSDLERELVEAAEKVLNAQQSDQ